VPDAITDGGAQVGFPVEEGGEPPPGSLFAALRLVPAVPGLLLCVLVKFPLDLPQLAQQPDEDGSGLRASGHLCTVPQAQAVGFLQHTAQDSSSYGQGQSSGWAPTTMPT
jgi:hypothetical protein